MNEEISEIQDAEELGSKIQFSQDNIPLLRQALTHKSAAQHGGEHNERLEFLGDSILGMIINEYLFHQYPDQPEGVLTRAKAAIVSEHALAEAAVRIHLGDYLRMSKGEDGSGGRIRHSLLSDAFEAVVAAIYLDGGLEASRDFILTALAENLESLDHGCQTLDYKSALQEFLQERRRMAPTYVTVREYGPDHNKTFVVEAHFGKTALGMGSGHCKKEAEQAAAKQALEYLKRNEPVDLPKGKTGHLTKWKATTRELPEVSWRPASS